MPTEGKRKRKGPQEYEIAVVSLGEARRTRNFRLSRFKLALLLLMGFAASIAVTIAVLVYTPLAMYVPIPNPGLERRYGRQIVQTQQRLNGLAEEVLTLKGYNLQLRRALGEDSTGRTQGATRAARSIQQEEDPEVQNPVPWQEMGSAGTVTPVSMTGMSGGTAVMGEVPFPLLRPVEGFISQGFDASRGHFGMDFAGKRGSLVSAAAEGRVVFAGWTYDDGNMLIVSHTGGYLTVYKHNQALLATMQAAVKRGEPIALLGTSGTTSLGPHLHFEVWHDGRPQDPEGFFFSSSRR
jgi:murein DD-endopeptidase MepM/ murein hydrolase activator NlpD